jgi:glycine/D-amino acid oxidase-like deaminating enzyme
MTASAPSDPSLSDAAPPDRCDVVVIGGGVIGVFAALTLAERGLSVTLCEKGRVAAEQSSRNWGWIRKQGRDARELPLMIEASSLWERTAATLDVDIGFGRRGVTYLAETEAELAVRERWLEDARGFQLDSRMLSAAETAALLGRDDRAFLGALHTPSDAGAEPRLAVPAVARRAQALGATVLEGCAARALDMEGGRVRGVLTERGRIACDAAILAGGAWSRTFLENMGVSLPQLAVLSSVQRTAPAPRIVDGAIGATGASLRRRVDGGYTVARSGAARFDLTPAAFRHFAAFAPMAAAQAHILKIRLGRAFVGPLGRRRWAADEPSPFERWRVLDPKPDHALLDATLAEATRLHPALGPLKSVERWAGMIDVTPDEVPVIDACVEAPGLVIATGCSGHGFGLGPGVGLLAGQLATGAAPIVDPAPFRGDRFGGAARKAA